jgi:hypothetical protein
MMDRAPPRWQDLFFAGSGGIHIFFHSSSAGGRIISRRISGTCILTFFFLFHRKRNGGHHYVLVAADVGRVAAVVLAGPPPLVDVAGVPHGGVQVHWLLRPRLPLAALLPPDQLAVDAPLDGLGVPGDGVVVEVVGGVEGERVDLLPAAASLDVVVGLDGALVVAEELEVDLVHVPGALEGGEVEVVVEPRGVPRGGADGGGHGAAREEAAAGAPARAVPAAVAVVVGHVDLAGVGLVAAGLRAVVHGDVGQRLRAVGVVWVRHRVAGLGF